MNNCRRSLKKILQINELKGGWIKELVHEWIGE